MPSLPASPSDETTLAMEAAEAANFTLRFEHAETHGMIRWLAARWGESMNRLAEDILERELRAWALLEEASVLQTLELLRAGSGRRSICTTGP
jgi:hypothetical protein